MKKLTTDRIESLDLPIATAWLMGECMQARGKQDLWMRQRPEVLQALREQAVVQSVESSNRIEGVSIAADRLRPLVLGKARPRDRSEEKLAGYRRALDWIFSRKRQVSFSPEVVLKLHALAQGGMSGDAGCWKSKNNEIIEILPNNERRVRFVPTPASETPDAVDKLCVVYQQIRENEQVPVLLTIATCIFDLLCIHPFRDGNGRASRLATTFLLIQEGFLVCRFISLERIVEQRKEEYYKVLEQCSKDWHDGKNNITAWWNFFLSVLKSAYGELAQKVEDKTSPGPKGDMVRRVINDQVGSFVLSEIAAQAPGVSLSLIKKILMMMKKEGAVKITGRGRGAVWEIIRKR
ncbi:MAG: Fic family protein [Deltaproteobacteria bacterium]|nr:Fic family protein [Deltaproteobacteria bacterium]